MKRYHYTIVRPGGNDTALINEIVTSISLQKRINDEIMKQNSNVEQVGFTSLNRVTPQLRMAGGEFCGNAARSTAWLALSKKPGEIYIKVSGVKKELRAGITNEGFAFAQMPIYPDWSKITQDKNNYIVAMEGITNYINYNTNEIEGLSAQDIKKYCRKFISQKKLDRFPAAGIMYCKKKNNVWNITPIVYVRAINTLFLETACASGTTALGAALVFQNKERMENMRVDQPSGMSLYVSIDFSEKKFTYAQISGPVTKLGEYTLMLE